MVDLNELKNYTTNINEEQCYSFYSKELIKVSVDDIFEYFKSLLTCRINKDGLRIMQTISFLYRINIAEYIYFVNNFIESEEDRDSYLNDLLEIHRANIEFEKLNPPIPFKSKKAKKSKVKEEKPQKEKKPTKLEEKLAAKAIKLSNLTFKLK